MRILLSLALALAVLPGCAELDALTLPSFNGCSQVRAYTFGQRVQGSLVSSDCLLLDDTSKRVDYYQLQVTETIDEARIRAGDGDLDAYMILYRRDGTELGRNDDITPVLNMAARVQRRLTPGTYIIAVTSSAGGQMGGYELSSTVERG